MAPTPQHDLPFPDQSRNWNIRFGCVCSIGITEASSQPPYGQALPPGAGKTHLAVALGREAILAGHSVQFVAATTVVAPLAKGHSEGRLDERLAHFAKPKLLIIDELGDLPL